MSEIAKRLNVSGAYLLNKWAGLSAYDDVAALVRIAESLEERLSAARVEGFEAARVQAAGIANAEAGECKRLKRSAEDMGATHARQSWQAAEASAEGVERRIRAMQDEQEQCAGDVCACGAPITCHTRDGRYLRQPLTGLVCRDVGPK